MRRAAQSGAFWCPSKGSPQEANGLLRSHSVEQVINGREVKMVSKR